MKVVVLHGEPKSCAIEEVPTPDVAANYCLVKIMTAPMCTEYHAYANGAKSRGLGHEAAGEVVKAGPQSRVKPGTRVIVMPQNGCGTCELCLRGEHIHCSAKIDPLAICGCSDGRATYAQYCIQQDWLLVPIPDGMSYDHAAMACCGLGPTFNAVNLLEVNAYHTVLVAGLGPVGLGGVINATHLGARVIGLDVNPYRLDLARKLGAADALDPTVDGTLEKILELTDGHGADAAIETANVPSSPPFLIEATRKKGKIGLVSWAGELPVRRIVGKGLTIVGCWHWNHFTHTERMLQVVARNSETLDTAITHTFPMAQVQDAWELQLTGQCGKVLLHPWA